MGLMTGQILNMIEKKRNEKHVIAIAQKEITSESKVTFQKKDLEMIELAKFASRIKLGQLDFITAGGVGKKADDGKYIEKDKSDRATTEQVLDPRTRMILFKLINRGVLFEINGCISTGKEANVYHALTPEKTHVAIKIYKTSILVFKDRDRYVSGEYRFRNGNPPSLIIQAIQNQILERWFSCGQRKR